jgi:hypothetical protein
VSATVAIGDVHGNRAALDDLVMSQSWAELLLQRAITTSPASADTKRDMALSGFSPVWRPNWQAFRVVATWRSTSGARSTRIPSGIE